MEANKLTETLCTLRKTNETYIFVKKNMPKPTVTTGLMLNYKAPLHTTKYFSVLQSTTPGLLCTTKYYSSTTTYYKVLLQPTHARGTRRCARAQRSRPRQKLLLQYYKVLLCTTQYYSSTTKYYSSTTTYYKVLLQNYKVLHHKRGIRAAYCLKVT